MPVKSQARPNKHIEIRPDGIYFSPQLAAKVLSHSQGISVPEAVRRIRLMPKTNAEVQALASTNTKRVQKGAAPFTAWDYTDFRRHLDNGRLNRQQFHSLPPEELKRLAVASARRAR